MDLFDRSSKTKAVNGTHPSTEGIEVLQTQLSQIDLLITEILRQGESHKAYERLPELKETKIKLKQHLAGQSSEGSLSLR